MNPCLHNYNWLSNDIDPCKEKSVDKNISLMYIVDCLI